MLWLTSAPIIKGGTSANSCVISKTIKMPVTGAPTTPPSVALIPTTASVMQIGVGHRPFQSDDPGHHNPNHAAEKEAG